MKRKSVSIPRTLGTIQNTADAKTVDNDARFDPVREIRETPRPNPDQNLGFGPSLAWEMACYAPQTEAATLYRRNS